MQKRSLYSKGLPVPQVKRADRNPLGSGPVVGSVAPAMTPVKQPRATGFASRRGYGLPPRPKSQFKLSGHPGAHQLGKK